MRLDESIAQCRLKNNSLEKISSEEFEYQTSKYTRDQLNKLFKDPEYKQHLSNRTQNWQQKADSDSELEVESQDETGESTIQKLFDKIFRIDQKVKQSRNRSGSINESAVKAPQVREKMNQGIKALIKKNAQSGRLSKTFDQAVKSPQQDEDSYLSGGKYKK